MREEFTQPAITLLALFMAACVVAFLIFLLPGCSSFSLLPRQQHSTEMRAAPVAKMTVSPHCLSLNRDVIALTATSIGLGALSGSAGVTAFFTSTTPRYAVIGTGLALTLGSGIVTSMSTSFASNFTQECTTPIAAPAVTP